MPVNYPTSLDSFVDPLATDDLETVDHAAQHVDKNDAVEALEAKVGITASTPTSGKVLTGGVTAGTSTWVTPASGAVDPGWPSFVGLPTFYGVPGATGTGDAAISLSSNRTYYGPSIVDTSMTFDRIGIYVTTALAGTARLGIYNADSAWQPTSLVLDAGTVDVGTTGGKAITINQTLAAGRYLLAVNSTSACSVRMLYTSPPIALMDANLTHTVQFYVIATIGSYPSTGTAWDSSTTSSGPVPFYQAVRLRRSA